MKKTATFGSTRIQEGRRAHSSAAEAPTRLFLSTIIPFFGSHGRLFSAPVPLTRSLCGLKVLGGHSSPLSRPAAARYPVTGNDAPPVGSVCFRRSNRPPENLLVPTIYGRDLYRSQSGPRPHLRRHKALFKAERDVWNVRLLCRCLIINVNLE